MCTYTHTFTHWGYFHGAAAFLEEGHRAKGRKEGRGQVQWHPEQRRFIEKGNDKHSAEWKQHPCTHSTAACKPPGCSSDSSWQEDPSPANPQLRHSLHLEQQLLGTRG